MNTELNTELNTPTPRTDAAQFIQHDMTAVVSTDFARTLERELAAERARLDWLQNVDPDSHQWARLDWLRNNVKEIYSNEYGIVCLCGDSIRAAIDAVMKEGAK